MKKTIFWFRRDLRLHDNHGLYRALKDSGNVLPIFIFDQNILDELEIDDPRVNFIYDQVIDLKKEINLLGGDLVILRGKPIVLWKKLIHEYDIKAVFTNHDYEPYAIQRDLEVQQLLTKANVEMQTFKDHVIFEKSEILTSTDSIYTVFTPYKRKWLTEFEEFFKPSSNNQKSMFPSEAYLDHFAPIKSSQLPELNELGFTTSHILIPSKEIDHGIIKCYETKRNYPALAKGTSRLGIHFRFGTISIRKKAIEAYELSETFLSELIWRDFYIQIMYNFPHVIERSFRPKYDRIQWRNVPQEFHAWSEGKTGYPIVDAGMRQLNTTGFMHNRVRMITASFLTKHLLIDWRMGEAYFARKLLDFELASNNGGWQWAAGSGTDAAPYFRIFNPTSQMEKFDKNREYIKKWVPEFGTTDYPDPIVDHKFARERCLKTYKSALKD